MNSILLLTVVILHVYHVTALDFNKCSITNSTCQQGFYQNVASVYAPKGIPEIGVPPLDPYHIKDITVPVLNGILKPMLVDGECLGIHTCRLLKYQTNLTNFHKIAEIECARVVIQGSYKIFTDPDFSQLFYNISGNGNGSIVLENWYFKFDYPFEMVKRSNGEIYTKAYFEKGEYISDILKKATFTADSIIVDGRDVTANVLAFLNTNWRILFKLFGQTFHQISVFYYYDAYAKFFDNIPATEYLSDDLMPYVKKYTDCHA